MNAFVKRITPIIAVCALLGLSFGALAASPPRLDLVRETYLTIYPPITAPGGRFEVSWKVLGGAAASATYVLWDTSTHDFRNDYAFHTAAQSGGMGDYSDAINTPLDAPAIYMKPYAMIDGVAVYGPVEYVVPTRLAINVGAELWGVDSAGQYWNPDREGDFAPMHYEIIGGASHTTSRPIANTDDDWIYQSQRQGLTAINYYIGQGVYEMTLEVILHFAEIELSSAGQRVFDVYLERGTANEVALRNIDPYALAGGADRAITVTAMVNVTIIPEDDERLNIEFESPGGDIPILNGILVRGVSAVRMYRMTQLVSLGADDTYCDQAGGHLADNEIWLGGNEQYHGGLRFPALQAPRYSLIRYGRLEVTASADAYMDTHLRIYAHAHDSSPAFNTQGIVQNRARTEHYTPWDLPGDAWIRNREYRSPSLREVLQEMVNRPGWTQGNAISLLLIAQPGAISAPRKVWSFEGSYTRRAKLTFYYTRPEDIPAATATPTSTATLTRTPTTTPTMTRTPTLTPTLTPTSGRRMALPVIVKG